MALGVSGQPKPIFPTRGPAVRGFSLIDVLVTMAVIAVLLSILTPSLSSIRETARQVICRSNIRQLGIGVTQFAAEHGDRVPPSVYVPEGSGTLAPWETMTLRIAPGSKWDGLGHLYEGEYTSAAQVFHCPSHTGNHRYQVYAPSWASESGLLVGNFQYRGRAEIRPGSSTDRLSGMSGGTSLISDGFRTQSDFNHQIGANLFRADNSVAWFSDREGTFSTRFSELPKDTASSPPNASLVQLLWQALDRP